MGKYIYPAVFSKEDDYYNVSFPDIPNCHTYGVGKKDAITMAKDAAALALFAAERDNLSIPSPTEISEIRVHNSAKEFVSYVEFSTRSYWKKYNSSASVVQRIYKRLVSRFPRPLSRSMMR